MRKLLSKARVWLNELARRRKMHQGTEEDFRLAKFGFRVEDDEQHAARRGTLGDKGRRAHVNFTRYAQEWEETRKK